MRVFLVALAVVLGIARPVGADPKHSEAEPPGDDDVLYACKEKTGEVSVTFKPQTELKDLVTWVMGFTCKNFVLDPRIISTDRKVTVIAPNKMSTREAYRVFLTALSTMGLTIVPKGNVLRIVESKTANGETLPIYKTLPDNMDQLVRVVVKPTYAAPEAMRTAFSAVKSDAGQIAVVGAMLVVTDYASNIEGMLQLQKLVDVPGGTEGIYTIPVKHGDASKIAPLLTQLFGSAPAAPAPARPSPPGTQPQMTTSVGEPSELAPSKILVDERTNTIVVSATEPAYQRAKAFVERIDVAVDLEGGGAIHIYPLQSAIAEELADTINRAISGDTALRPTTTTSTGAPVRAPMPTPAAASAPPAALDALGQSLQGKVHIMPDSKSNKLLITSSTHDFLAIKDVIRELDQPRRQVYIEAMILEVSADNDVNYGVSAHGGIPGTGLALGGIQLGTLKSTDPSSLATATGLIGGLIGAPLSGQILGTGTSIPSYGVLVQALATTQN
ncbi:MAG TPA: secretin N-terminal domain-containing protein, partial [Kofleriaceae bacterium]|nr:secretin N-terminal domain-containing protein [Kofleriaceae bacterium]